jgi:integrase
MPRPKKQAPNRKDGLYEIKITIGKRLDGSLIRKSFYSHISKEDARKQAERYKIEHAVAERTGAAFVEHTTAFNDWAEKWLTTYKLGKVKGNTYYSTYRGTVQNHLIPYFGAALLDNIKPLHVQMFFNEKGKTCSHESMKKMRSCLHGIFQTAMENNLCTANPVTDSLELVSKVPPAQKKTYTKEQYEVVEQAALQAGALDVLVLLRTGISRSELLGLKWDDFDTETSTLNIRQGLVQYMDSETEQWALVSDGLKNSFRHRPIPIDHQLCSLLNAKPRIIPVGGNQKKGIPPTMTKTEFIFHSSTGGMMSPTNWYKRNYKSFMAAVIAEHPEVPFLTPHELRHTRATLWKDEGVDLFSIAKLMGHADLDMLAKRYAHNNVDTLRKALKLDNPPAEDKVIRYKCRSGVVVNLKRPKKYEKPADS